MEGPSEEHESPAMACLTRSAPGASPSRPLLMPRMRITVRLARVTVSRAAATTSLNLLGPESANGMDDQLASNVPAQGQEAWHPYVELLPAFHSERWTPVTSNP